MDPKRPAPHTGADAAGAPVFDHAILHQQYVIEHASIRAIAAQYGLTAYQVRARMDAWGIACRRRGRPPVQIVITSAMRETVRSMVHTCGVPTTARLLQVTPIIIHAIIGIRPLTRGTPRRVADDAAVRHAHDAGTSVAELALRFGCTKRTIWRSLQRSAVQVPLPAPA